MFKLLVFNFLSLLPEVFVLLFLFPFLFSRYFFFCLLLFQVKQCLEKKSQDLNRQVECLLELTATVSRNLVAYPSNKQKCLGHPGSMYQDVQ